MSHGPACIVIKMISYLVVRVLQFAVIQPAHDSCEYRLGYQCEGMLYQRSDSGVTMLNIGVYRGCKSSTLLS